MNTVRYAEVSQARVDDKGNLRLLRRTRLFFVRVDIFHPAGEWAAVRLSADGVAVVELQRRVPQGGELP